MIELSDVSKKYVSYGNTVYALKNISLKIKDGEFVCITGESGCGKTTLLNVISGMVTPSEGEIKYDDTITDRDRSEVRQYRRERIS